MPTDRLRNVVVGAALAAAFGVGLAGPGAAQTPGSAKTPGPGDAAQSTSAAVVTMVAISSTGRPPVAGDVMTVLATGPVNGTAIFMIEGGRVGVPMRESIAEPGTYVGTYVTRSGDRVIGSNVVVTITTPGNQTVTAAAPVQFGAGTAAAEPAPAPRPVNTPTQ